MLSLVTLTVQNSAMVLILRYSRTLTGPSYLPTTAVLLAELLKLFLSVLLYAANTPWPSASALAAMLPRAVFSDRWYLLAVPAILYTTQNNLQYQAVSRLDAATFAVTYQLKILTTALCSVWLLKRSLSPAKWTALVVLTAGVALVSVPSSSSSTSGGASSSTEPSAAVIAAEALATHTRLQGLACVILACLISGLAGVYFEMILKGSKTSLWIRNVQLALFSLVPALFSVFFVDGARVSAEGFFVGYTGWTWAAILIQALGGLIVSLVVKYADNILKGFATSVSILLSSVTSVFLFDFELSLYFTLGASLVMAATYLYGRPDPAPKTPLPSFRDENGDTPTRSWSMTFGRGM
ncbi:nucleotide-sugar transporter-domain-containing protein [Blastocladiella britannica]|nr:nucleotide-sugar transporter-domain-containing protein [Blastocladiella britannica]